MQVPSVSRCREIRILTPAFSTPASYLDLTFSYVQCGVLADQWLPKVTWLYSGGTQLDLVWTLSSKLQKFYWDKWNPSGGTDAGIGIDVSGNKHFKDEVGTDKEQWKGKAGAAESNTLVLTEGG